MNKVKISFLASALAATIFISGCSQVGSSQKVAEVNGTVITKAQYDKTYDELQKSLGLGAANVPPDQKKMLDDYLEQMTLNKLIMQTLINNEAAKDGITVSQAEVEKYKQEKIFKDPMLKSQFQKFLAESKMQESDFDAMLKENLLLNKFMEKKAGPAIQVSETEVKTFYNKNTDQFKIPESIHAKHILVKAIEPQMKQELRSKDPKISDAELQKDIQVKKEALKDKAEKLLAEVKAKPDSFDSLAQKNSEDPMSAQRGGDLGFMPAGTVDPAFWSAAEKTPVGKLYPDVVTSQFGYHIIKVLERKPAHQQTFDEAKASIQEQMTQQKKQAFIQQWAQQQRAVAKVEVEPAYQPKQEKPEQSAAAPQAGGMPAPAAPAVAPSAEKH